MAQMPAWNLTSCREGVTLIQGEAFPGKEAGSTMEQQLIKAVGLDGRARDYIAYPKAVPPYPRSERIVGVKADRFRYHCGEGDMWPLTWGADGNIYAAAGDNKGSPMNFWRISQYSSWNNDGSGTANPAKLTNTNDWTIDLIDNLPVDPKIYCQNPAAPGIKPAGILDIDGTLYLAVEANSYGDRPLFNRQHNYHGWIITSADCGKTWNREATPTDFFTGRLSSCHFLQFGRGYQGARDGYVYAYFPVDEDGESYWENADGLLLGRVPKERILERGAWEFCASPDGTAWSREEQDARPVFSYYKMTGSDHVCYNPGLGCYLLGNYSFVDPQLHPRPIHQLSWPEAYRSQLTLFEAPEPWGPWSLFYQDDDWGTYGDYQPVFPTKWISPDGRCLFMVSSGSWDDYNFVVQKLALKLAGDADFPPESRYFTYR